MEIITARSTTSQPSLVHGPTVTLVNLKPTPEAVEGPDGETHTDLVYTSYRFDAGEYDLVRTGILPAGAEWDAELRRIERSALLDEADKRIAEAQDNIAAGTAGDWQEHLDALRAYKMAVRATKTAEGFPETAEYPQMPEI